MNIATQYKEEHKEVESWQETAPREAKLTGIAPDTTEDVIYSKRLSICPFSTPPLENYAPILGNERVERLKHASERLKGLKMLELNSTAQGGGVAEMLYSSVPFLNSLGIDADWKVIRGEEEFFKCTKGLHNLLQGMKGVFRSEMERIYYDAIANYARSNIIDSCYDVVMVNDPQPLGLAFYFKRPGETWLWRCHIDIEQTPMDSNLGLWDFMSKLVERFDSAIFSAAHYIVSRWPLPTFIIPPFIDPLSEKNRELSQEEINAVLSKYDIDTSVPIITQIGRFDPWKGLDRTIATYRHVRKEQKCQLILAGGMASDDPEGEQILSGIYEETKNEDDIRILNLPLANRLENWKEINALQRAATVIMQPSTREGFGLVITEALWKEKPVIAANVGAIPLQIRDGDTGYFYESPRATARRIVELLKHPKAAEAIGKRGKEYISEHFLIPDRVADYLMAIDMSMQGNNRSYYKLPHNCVISFHPWFKMSKRKNPSRIFV